MDSMIDLVNACHAVNTEKVLERKVCSIDKLCLLVTIVVRCELLDYPLMHFH
jgi:hypothetical protein